MQAVILSSADQGSSDWLDARKKGIGSSEVGTLLGLNDYETPITLYKKKLNLVPDTIDNWNMQRGRALEPEIRKHYANTRNINVLNMPGVLAHPEYSFLLASLDGFTESPNRLTEFKAPTSRFGWGDEGTDQVPPMYLMQVQQAMFVTGLEVADIAASFGGREPVYYEVPADKELQQMLLEVAHKFWHENILKQVEPEPITLSEKMIKYTITEGNAVYGNAQIQEAYLKLIDTKAMIKEMDAMKEALEDGIKGFMLESGGSVLLDANGRKLATWNESAGREGLDSKALKAELPDIYEKYKTSGKPFRTFRTYGE
jgi:putative phage-type endonuclease